MVSAMSKLRSSVGRCRCSGKLRAMRFSVRDVFAHAASGSVSLGEGQ